MTGEQRGIKPDPLESCRATLSPSRQRFLDVPLVAVEAATWSRSSGNPAKLKKTENALTATIRATLRAEAKQLNLLAEHGAAEIGLSFPKIISARVCILPRRSR